MIFIWLISSSKMPLKVHLCCDEQQDSSFLWLNNIPLYIPQFLCPFIHGWTLWLFPYFTYWKYWCNEHGGSTGISSSSCFHFLRIIHKVELLDHTDWHFGSTVLVKRHSRQKDIHRKGFTEEYSLSMAGTRAHVRRWVGQVTGEELFKDSACLPEEFRFCSTGSEIFLCDKIKFRKNYLVSVFGEPKKRWDEGSLEATEQNLYFS